MSSVPLAMHVPYVVLAALALGACGGRAPQSSQPSQHAPALASQAASAKLPAKAFFIPGEAMLFSVSLRGIEGGEATLVAGEPGMIDGHRVQVIRSELRSAGLVDMVKKIRDDSQSWVDLDRGTTLRNRSEFLFGEMTLTARSEFRGNQIHVEFMRNGMAGRRHIRLPPGEIGYDGHAVLGALRVWEPALGDQVSFYGISGRRVWRVTLTASRYETIQTQLGAYPALRVEGSAQRLTYSLEIDKTRKARSVTLWLSDDANRLPLKVIGTTEYGNIIVELTAYERQGSYVSQR